MVIQIMKGRGVCRLGHICVRRLRKSCGPECGWPCWPTPPCAAASWRRRHALPPHACLLAALKPLNALKQEIQPHAVDAIRMYRTFWEANASVYWGKSFLANFLSCLTWPHAAQTLEEELSMAAGSQRSMHSASFTSADGGSIRSQGSFPRHPPSHPPHGLGETAQPSTFSV